MPIVKCEDCGHDVSTEALACPNCGRPMKVAPEPTPAPASAQPPPAIWPPPKPVAPTQPASPKKNWFRRHPILTVILGLIVLGAIGSAAAGNGKDSGAPAAATNNANSAPSESSTPAGDSQATNGSSSTHATDSYTPHVGPHGSVWVDTQTWRLLGVRTTKRIGDQYAGSTADGSYLVLHLSVNNGKGESVTINDDMVKLEVNGDEYSADSNGDTALELSGAKTFFLKDLGPHVTTSGFVAFDVPRQVPGEAVEACFHEIGFGSSKGCIRLR